MKNYRKENKIKENILSEHQIIQNIDDPELQLIISDVMIHSGEYTTYIDDTIDDIQDWF